MKNDEPMEVPQPAIDFQDGELVQDLGARRRLQVVVRDNLIGGGGRNLIPVTARANTCK